MLDEIKAVLEESLTPIELRVAQEGSHCEVLVVSEVFEGLRKMQRQQKVYACLNKWIASGELHAVSMHTHTQEEWQTINSRGF